MLDYNKKNNIKKNQGLEKYFNIFELVFNKFKNQHVKGAPKEIKINWI